MSIANSPATIAEQGVLLPSSARANLIRVEELLSGLATLFERSRANHDATCEEQATCACYAAILSEARRELDVVLPVEWLFLDTVGSATESPRPGE